jgi:hypothetical protein
MRLLATTSWTTIWLIATTWALALLLANAIAVWLAIRALLSSSEASGGLAAVGGGLTQRGAVVVFGPPLALLALKWIVGRR